MFSHRLVTLEASIQQCTKVHVVRQEKLKSSPGTTEKRQSQCWQVRDCLTHPSFPPAGQTQNQNVVNIEVCHLKRDRPHLGGQWSRLDRLKCRRRSRATAVSPYRTSRNEVRRRFIQQPSGSSTLTMHLETHSNKKCTQEKQNHVQAGRNDPGKLSSSHSQGEPDQQVAGHCKMEPLLARREQEPKVWETRADQNQHM